MNIIEKKLQLKKILRKSYDEAGTGHGRVDHESLQVK